MTKISELPLADSVDGTEPLQGQVAIDALQGALYFNPLDAGKAIACSISYLQSE